MGKRGQSMVEFALILPILLIIFLAVADFARIYTSLMTVESAAREAADFGAWNSSNWCSTGTCAANYDKTVADMTERGCIAARSLPDYVGPDTACTNPAMTVQLTEADGSPASAPCDDPDRTPAPCRVAVTMDYEFHMIVPLSLDFFGVHLGFPSTLSFQRTSIFAISDFALDETP